MKTLDEIRREHIRTILEENGWDMKKASSILKISESKLQREIQKFAKPTGGEKRKSKGRDQRNGKG